MPIGYQVSLEELSVDAFLGEPVVIFTSLCLHPNGTLPSRVKG